MLYYIECPNCNDLVEINSEEFNCKIYRHGIYKENFKQIDPHLPKDICDELFNKNMIYGCGKPFKVIVDDEYNVFIEKCGYI